MAAVEGCHWVALVGRFRSREDYPPVRFLCVIGKKELDFRRGEWLREIWRFCVWLKVVSRGSSEKPLVWMFSVVVSMVWGGRSEYGV
jgi:hypothetical protein